VGRGDAMTAAGVVYASFSTELGRSACPRISRLIAFDASAALAQGQPLTSRRLIQHHRGTHERDSLT
jgi:hypothetical protein